MYEMWQDDGKLDQTRRQWMWDSVDLKPRTQVIDCARIVILLNYESEPKKHNNDDFPRLACGCPADRTKISFNHRFFESILNILGTEYTTKPINVA